MKSMLLLLGLIVFTPFQSGAYPLTPNAEWSKGSLCNRQNPDYAGDRYSQKIPYCKRNVEFELKSKLYDMYKVPEKCRNRYTIDHIIPLSIGGDNTPQNLWPEHQNIKALRMHLEEEVFEEVKAGTMTQKEAIQVILNNKFTAKQPRKGNTDCD